jgi:hypothetical protein
MVQNVSQSAYTDDDAGDQELKTNWSGYIIIIGLAIIFLDFALNKINEPEPVPAPAVNSSAESQENFSNLTNPDYLASPEKITVDKENEIPSYPPHRVMPCLNPSSKEEYLRKKYFSDSNQPPAPVWVEDVLDENTLKVSYITTLNEERFLTFAAISLYGLGDISNDCQKKETIAFLKSNFKNRHIYLSSRSSLLCGKEEEMEYREENKIFKQFKEKYPIMSKRLMVMDAHMIRGADTKDTQTTYKLYPAFRDDSTKILPFGDMDVSKSIIASGYGADFADSEKIDYSPMPAYYFYLEMKTAKAAKRGYWSKNACGS